MNYFIHKAQHIFSSLITVGLLLPYRADAVGLSFNVKNHLTVNSVEDLLVAILNIFIVLVTPLIVLYIIYAGFLYVTARGNVAQTEQATKALTYAIIGGVLILGAVALSAIIANIVGSFATP